MTNKVKAASPRGTVAAFQIDKDTKKVETLNGFTLVENGERVYSPSNKPTAIDSGAFKADGKTGIADDVAWDARSGVYSLRQSGSTALVTQFLGGDSCPSFQLRAGYKNGGLSYRSARDSFGFEEGWERIYTTKYKPTLAELGAFPTSGGIATGIIGVNNASGESQVNVIKGGRTASLYDSGTTLGLYSRGGPEGDGYIIHKYISNGNISVGDTKNGLYMQGSNKTFNYNSQNVYHTGFKPTADEVGAVATKAALRPTGGNSVYFRVASIAKTDSDVSLIMGGGTDHGNAVRNMFFVTMGSRSNTVTVKIRRFWESISENNRYRFFTKDGGSTFELWIRTPPFMLTANYQILSGAGYVINNDSLTSTAPDGLTEHAQHAIYDEGFKPSASDIKAAPAGYGLGEHGQVVGTQSQFIGSASSGVPGLPTNGAGWQSTYGPTRRAQLFMSSGGVTYSRFSLSDAVTDTATEWAIHYTSKNKPSASDLKVVPDTRKVNNKVLSGDITLTPADVSAVAKSGDTMTGALNWSDSNKYVNGSGSDIYIAAKAGKVYIEGKDNPVVRLGSSNYNLYHQGFKPTLTELGAAPSGFGVGGLAKLLPANANYAGNVQEGGFYLTDASATDKPSGWGSVRMGLISMGNSAYDSQIAMDSGSSGMAFRTKVQSTGTFRPWQKIYHEGFKPTAADVGAVPTSRKVNGRALTGDITVTANDVGAVAKAGDTMTGTLTLTGTFANTTANAMIAMHGNGTAGQQINLRSMREHNSSSWSWEKIANGNLYYGTGTSGSANKIRLDTSAGEIYLQDATKRVYHQGFKPTAADVGALPASGNTVTSIIDNTTNIGKTATTYETITNWAHHVGSSKFVTPTSTNNPTTQGGYWKTLGRRDSSGGYAGIWVDYSNSQPGVFIGKNETGANAPVWARVYTDKFKPTATDVGALPLTGGTLTGPLKIPTGFVVNNSDVLGVAGDLVRLGSADSSRPMVLRAKDLNLMVDGGGATYRIYHQGYKPTAADVGALPLAGGVLTGSVELAVRKSALVVKNKASIRYADGGNIWWHNFADSNVLRWNTGDDAAQTAKMSLDSNGNLGLSGGVAASARSRFTRNGISGWPNATVSDANNFINAAASSFVVNNNALHIFGNGTTNARQMGIQSGHADATYTTSPGILELNPYGGEVRSNGKRVISDAHLIPMVGGVIKWADLINKVPVVNASGVTELGRYIDMREEGSDSDFGWRWDAGAKGAGVLILKNGSGATVTEFHGTGDLISPVGKIRGRKLETVSDTNPMVEWHSPSKKATISYLNATSGDWRFSDSDGAGGETNYRFVSFNDGSFITRGAIRTDSTGGSAWNQTNNAPFRVNPLLKMGSGGYGKLLSHTIQNAGHFVMENSLGSYLEGDGWDKLSHTMVSTDGGNTTATWKFRNDGWITPPTSSYYIPTDGNIVSTRWGGRNIWEACIQSFAPASDARLKTVLGKADKSALGVVEQLNFKKFVWNDEAGKVYTTRDKKTTDIGLIAQEVEAIDPSLVKTINSYDTEGNVETEVKALDTAALLSVALKAIQELTAKVESLESQLKTK